MVGGIAGGMDVLLVKTSLGTFLLFVVFMKLNAANDPRKILFWAEVAISAPPPPRAILMTPFKDCIPATQDHGGLTIFFKLDFEIGPVHATGHGPD